jgi:hypothetical protein
VQDYGKGLDGVSGLPFDDANGHTLIAQAQRGDQAYRAGAYNEDLGARELDRVGHRARHCNARTDRKKELPVLGVASFAAGFAAESAKAARLW